ncbi:MAG: hypothetical protein RIR26_389 [Pseudomonadota bacterium]|jgi:integrase
MHENDSLKGEQTKSTEVSAIIPGKKEIRTLRTLSDQEAASLGIEVQTYRDREKADKRTKAIFVTVETVSGQKCSGEINDVADRLGVKKKTLQKFNQRKRTTDSIGSIGLRTRAEKFITKDLFNSGIRSDSLPLELKARLSTEQLEAVSKSLKTIEERKEKYDNEANDIRLQRRFQVEVKSGMLIASGKSPDGRSTFWLLATGVVGKNTVAVCTLDAPDIITESGPSSEVEETFRNLCKGLVSLNSPTCAADYKARLDEFRKHLSSPVKRQHLKPKYGILFALLYEELETVETRDSESIRGNLDLLSRHLGEKYVPLQATEFVKGVSEVHSVLKEVLSRGHANGPMSYKSASNYVRAIKNSCRKASATFPDFFNTLSAFRDMFDAESKKFLKNSLRTGFLKSKERHEPLTLDQVKMLLRRSAEVNTRLLNAAALAFSTGFRPEEFIRLEKKHLKRTTKSYVLDYSRSAELITKPYRLRPEINDIPNAPASIAVRFILKNEDYASLLFHQMLGGEKATGMRNKEPTLVTAIARQIAEVDGLHNFWRKQFPAEFSEIYPRRIKTTMGTFMRYGAETLRFRMCSDLTLKTLLTHTDTTEIETDYGRDIPVEMSSDSSEEGVIENCDVHFGLMKDLFLKLEDGRMVELTEKTQYAWDAFLLKEWYLLRIKEMSEDEKRVFRKKLAAEITLFRTERMGNFPTKIERETV